MLRLCMPKLYFVFVFGLSLKKNRVVWLDVVLV